MKRLATATVLALVAMSCGSTARSAPTPSVTPTVVATTSASLAPTRTASPVGTTDNWAMACGTVSDYVGNTASANGAFVLNSPGRSPLKVALTAAHSTLGVGSFGGYVCAGLEAGVPYPTFAGLGAPGGPGFVAQGTLPATAAKPTPTGFVLPQACAFVATPVVGTDQTNWSLDCGAANNNNARGTLGPALTQQGWASCAVGLATAQWQKSGVMLSVVESTLAPGEYMQLIQPVRLTSPCV